jgi:hypothetical protein
MDLYILDVPTVAEIGEVALHQGVSNWKATVIWLEVTQGRRRIQYHLNLILGLDRGGNGARIDRRTRL